jgi:hypothetical protein
MRQPECNCGIGQLNRKFGSKPEQQNWQNWKESLMRIQRKTAPRISALSTILLIGGTAAILSAGGACANSLGGSVRSSVSSATGAVHNVTSGITNTVGGIAGDSTGNGTTAGNGTSLGGVTGTVGNLANTGNVGQGGAGNGATVGDFAGFVRNLDNGNLTNPNLGNVKNVRLVDVSDAFKNVDTSALDNALANNQTQVDSLRNDLNNDSALNNLLAAHDVSLSHVVGVSNVGNGSIVIYTDRSNQS